MKKKLLFIGVPLALVILIGGLLYRNFVTSPKYSLLKIKESLENHDISTFEKYVDINGIVVRLLTELPDILNIEKDAGFLGEEAMQLFTTVMQDSITKVAKESVRSFVERGHFDKQLTKKGILSKIIKDLPVDNLKISGLKEIRKEGKICKVPIDIFVAAYEGNFTLEFMMRDKGGYWQVAEISNLPKVICNIAELQKTFPYRNRYAAVLYMANSIKDARHKALSLADIATALAKTGNNEKAEVVFSEAIETAGLIKDAWHKAKALAGIARALAKAGKIEKAIETAGSIKDAGHKAEALAGIARALAKAGKIEKAIETAGSIKDAGYKASALADIATELAKAGKAEKAEVVFSEAIKVAGSIKDTWPKASALEEIATALAKTGNNEKAEVVFSEAIETAGSIKDAWPKASALADIATALAKAGKIEKAIETASSIKKALCKASALQNITIELAKLKPKDKQEDAEIANSIMTALNR